ncbi:conserved hypothetical protein [Parafrankia sp. Ea1.12]|nr:conserved hypothetical protein [Parafrankia sp. Ea1.12]
MCGTADPVRLGNFSRPFRERAPVPAGRFHPNDQAAAATGQQDRSGPGSDRETTMKTHSIAGQARRRWMITAGALGLGAVVALAGCSDSSGTAGATETRGATTTPDASTTDATTTDATQAACAAQLASNWVGMPGIDPDSPPPSATEVQTWAASVEPHLGPLRAGVPGDVASQVDVLAETVRGAAEGKPPADPDGSMNTALTAVNAWAHDTCGYTTLDVTNSDGSGLAGVPASLPAGPVALKFTNTGDPAKAGFILLLGRVRDGETATAADVQSGKTNIEAVADIVAVAQPTGSDPAYGLTTLVAGRYIVTTPIGAPPQFSGVIAAGFEVS